MCGGCLCNRQLIRGCCCAAMDSPITHRSFISLKHLSLMKRTPAIRSHHRLKTFGGWLRPTIGRRDRDVDLADRKSLPDHPGLHRPVPATARAGMRGTRCRADEVARSDAAPGSPRRASIIGSNGPSTKPGAAQTTPGNRRSRRANSETTCATCCLPSKAHPVPAPSAPGSNDPREPEEPLPDWAPDEPAATPLPDDPPSREPLIRDGW